MLISMVNWQKEKMVIYGMLKTVILQEEELMINEQVHTQSSKQI
jgi:hypothetical protein